ncbi:ImmA/IrrE family metallo-endopeptidase [Arachnia propionica]|uniref:ImmA/IrrE family metallo-endopeptidase n=1 Tax=Arachnia propionica TaxID=1750 RepID=UPI0016396CC0|nr:ImmA/IrrE family metallo-endopeptidase [Arachnia propionica]
MFVNANQTSNGQLFTLAHEFAHVWRGSSGIGNEQEPDVKGGGPVEQWCNQVAAEFLVPSKDLEKVWVEYRDLPLRELLDRLTGRYRCGTVVVLLAIHRLGLTRFTDIDAEYRRELDWLASRERTASKEGGNYCQGLPLKIGERFSKALVQDTLEGRTEFAQALRLLSMNRTATFDRYAEHLKVS